MYSVVKPSKVSIFEWDRGNVDKSLIKHKIKPAESEEVFQDENQLILKDIKHSLNEERLAIIGQTTKRKVLFVAFTLRSEKVRIISARPANTKERRLYKNLS